MVLMIFHPPLAVPSAVAAPQLAITHRGASKLDESPRRINAIAINPIDFWTSLEPWLRARTIEEGICIRRKKRLALGVALRKMRRTTFKKSAPKMSPSKGEITREATT